MDLGPKAAAGSGYQHFAEPWPRHPPFLAEDAKPFFEAAAFWRCADGGILRLRVAALSPLRYHWLWDVLALPGADTPKALERSDWQRFGLTRPETNGIELRLLNNGDGVLVLREWLRGDKPK